MFEIPEMEYQKNGLDNNGYVVMTKSGFVEVPTGYVGTHAYAIDGKPWTYDMPTSLVSIDTDVSDLGLS